MSETRRSTRIAAQPKKEEPAPKPARKPSNKRTTGDAAAESGPATKKVRVVPHIFPLLELCQGRGDFFSNVAANAGVQAKAAKKEPEPAAEEAKDAQEGEAEKDELDESEGVL